MDHVPLRLELPALFRPFMREADLARMCLADGLNALIRAHHMNKGLYSQAFFNTSVGLERLMKLIYLIDYGVRHDGKFPSQEQLKKRFNHDLGLLYAEMSSLKERPKSRGAGSKSRHDQGSVRREDQTRRRASTPLASRASG